MRTISNTIMSHNRLIISLSEHSLCSYSQDLAMYIKANHRVFKGAPQPKRATTKLSSCAWFHVRDETTELSLNAHVCTKQYPSVLINVMLGRALKNRSER